MIKPVAAFVRPSTEEILAGELRLQDAVSNIAHVFSTGVHIRSEAGTVSTGTAEALQATCPSDHTTYSILVNLGEALFLTPSQCGSRIFRVHAVLTHRNGRGDRPGCGEVRHCAVPHYLWKGVK
jgi:hypothetical protein